MDLEEIQEEKCYLVLDESGAMHLKNERYFVIAGYLTNNLSKIINCHKKIEHALILNKHCSLKNHMEFKASKISPKQQADFINALLSIDNVVGVSITIDKYQLNHFGASENLAYNYFVKNLLNYLLYCKISLFDNAQNITLLLDNRSIAIKNLQDLKAFINFEFSYTLGLDKFFDVIYLDSKTHREIQMADYVANALWKSYNKSNSTILHHLDMQLFNKIKQSKFPYKTFGLNPPQFKFDK